MNPDEKNQKDENKTEESQLNDDQRTDETEVNEESVPTTHKQDDPAISDKKDLISEEKAEPETEEESEPPIFDKKDLIIEKKAEPQDAISDKEELIVENEPSKPAPKPKQEEHKQEAPKQPAPAPKPKVQDKPAISDKEHLISEEKAEPQDAISDKEHLIIEEEKASVNAQEPKSHIAENQVKRDELTPEQKAAQLTEAELEAARRLWAKQHIGQAQKKSNESRHARMLERMNELEKLVKAKPNATVHELANKMNLSERLTSGYLQKLVHAGRIKASGNTNSRRYS